MEKFAKFGRKPDPRNLQARTELERQLFAGQVARGEIKPADRFGLPMSAGDRVLCQFDAPPVGTIASVSAVTEMEAPDGLVRVLVHIEVPAVLDVRRSAPMFVCLPHLNQPAAPPAPQPASASGPEPAEGETPTGEPGEGGPPPITLQ